MTNLQADAEDALWSCFGCDFIGFCDGEENEAPFCPCCGTQDGDGFGMFVNDPRYTEEDAIAAYLAALGVEG